MSKEKSRYLGLGLIAGSLLLGATSFLDFLRTDRSDFRLMLSPNEGIGYHSGRLEVLRRIPCMLLPEDLRKPLGLQFGGTGKATLAYPLSVLTDPKHYALDYRVADTKDCKSQTI